MLANIAQLALGGYEAYEGIKGLNELSNTPYPQFTEAPELRNAYNRAEGMAGKGYTAEETAAFRQNLAGQSAQRYQRATDQAGGNLSQAIQGGINYGNIKGLLNFASDDASLHRRNIAYADSIAHAVQSQKNLITQGNIAHRNQLEQAYGGAVKKGLENIVNPLNLTQALNWNNGKTSGANSLYGVPLGNQPPANNLAPYQYPPTTDYATNSYGTGGLSVNPYPYPYSDFSIYGLKQQNPYTSAH